MRRRLALAVSLAVPCCQQNSDARPATRAPRSGEPSARSEAADPVDRFDNTEKRRADPLCSAERLLKVDCYDKYGPEFGEDAWGLLTSIGRDVSARGRVGDCFKDFGASGLSDFIPPMSAKCYLGPRNRCVPVYPPEKADDPWEYEGLAEDAKSVWNAFPHSHEGDGLSNHVRVGWTNESGQCEGWVEAYADLDNDGFYSTYIRGYTDDGITRDVQVYENPAKRDWNQPPAGARE